MGTLDYNSPIEYPRNLTKDGCTFDGWDSNITNMLTHNINITAQWIASMMTIVFDRKTFVDTSALEEVVREIAGTENVIIEFITDEDEDEEGSTIICNIKFVDQKSEEEISEVMEGIQSKDELRHAVDNITINGVEWSSNNNNNNTTIIIIVVVVVVVIAVVVFLLAFAGGFLIGRNRDSEGRRRDQGGAFSRVAEESTRAVDGSAFRSRFRNRKKIYPDDYVPPEGIANVLVKAGLEEGAANEIANMCRTTIEVRDMGERIAGDFTLDDAAAVCLYTLDFGDYRYEMSPYNLLNRELRAEKNVVKEIVKVRDVLYLVMTALWKLPFLFFPYSCHRAGKAIPPNTQINQFHPPHLISLFGSFSIFG